MSKYGLYCQFIAIFLVGMTTFKAKALTLENNNLQHQKYDYIDVAKETVSGRSKGQTTRIFTTADELDEEFWLKYLGEDFRHAVHLHIDHNNNVIPMEYKKPQRQQKKYSAREEKRTRFVRQPLKENTQLTVESLYRGNKDQYPTEKPETFNVNPNYTSSHGHSTNIFNNKKTATKHKNKLLIHNEYKQRIFKPKPLNMLKAIHKPIVVNLPEIDNSEQQINEGHVPVVFQIPPVIYHRKANLYPGKLSNPQLVMYDDEIPNLSLGNHNMALYREKIQNAAPQYRSIS